MDDLLLPLGFCSGHPDWARGSDLFRRLS
jgi:hypothetical protein